jgi:hypothetical protein
MLSQALRLGLWIIVGLAVAFLIFFLITGVGISGGGSGSGGVTTP